MTVWQLSIMYDIAMGVDYLHTRRPSIVHRDLKSLNVLIDHLYHGKINDFGLARIRQRAAETLRTVCGTPNWQAPEMWQEDAVYTEKVDVGSTPSLGSVRIHL